MSDTYRKRIKERISKLHTAIGMKANPLLDSDLGADIVADITRTALREQANEATKPHEKALPMCGVVLRSEQLLAYHKWYLENRGTVTNSSPEAMVRMYLSQ